MFTGLVNSVADGKKKESVFLAVVEYFTFLISDSAVGCCYEAINSRLQSNQLSGNIIILMLDLFLIVINFGVTVSRYVVINSCFNKTFNHNSGYKKIL